MSPAFLFTVSTPFCTVHPAGFVVSLAEAGDRKSTRLNSSHTVISYAVFCLKKKTKYTVHGALAEYVGRHLAPASPDVMVTHGGHYFVMVRRRSKLHGAKEEGGEPLSVVVRP